MQERGQDRERQGEPRELSPEELDAEAGVELPDRQVLTVLGGPSPLPVVGPPPPSVPPPLGSPGVLNDAVLWDGSSVEPSSANRFATVNS